MFFRCKKSIKSGIIVCFFKFWLKWIFVMKNNNLICNSINYTCSCILKFFVNSDMDSMDSLSFHSNQDLSITDAKLITQQNIPCPNVGEFVLLIVLHVIYRHNIAEILLTVAFNHKAHFMR